jgi:hypothetical protein
MLVSSYRAKKPFTFGPSETYQISWHAEGWLDMAFEANGTVKLRLDNEYVCDWAN